MHKFTTLAIVLFLLSLFIGRQSYAVSERFNVGVGYGGVDELTISTDSPGEFNYRLFLRTANNTESWVKVHYTGISNLSRSIRLHCASGEQDAVDNPTTGTCITGGPFVRGAFVAGNDNQFAVVKLFTLFCGSIQVEKQVTTTTWNSDFDTNTVEEFLDNGASSTWCPANSPTSSPTPTPKKIILPTNKPTSTPTPTKKPTPTKMFPTPTLKLVVQSAVTTIPTPTLALVQTKVTESTPESNSAIWLMVGGGVVLSTLIGVGFLKRNNIKTFLSSLSNKNAASTEAITSDQISSQLTNQIKE